MAVLEECTVIVTPSISEGERLMKKECLDRCFPFENRGTLVIYSRRSLENRLNS